VDTTVVAQDGETIILGGIISKRDARAETKIPVLGDIPYVGAAFRYRLRTHTRKELLIILTPHIVKCKADMDRVALEETQRLHWMLPDIMRTHGVQGRDLWPGVGPSVLDGPGVPPGGVLPGGVLPNGFPHGAPVGPVIGPDQLPAPKAVMPEAPQAKAGKTARAPSAAANMGANTTNPSGLMPGRTVSAPVATTRPAAAGSTPSVPTMNLNGAVTPASSSGPELIIVPQVNLPQGDATQGNV